MRPQTRFPGRCFADAPAYEVRTSLSSAEQWDAAIVREKLYSAFAMGPDAAMYELYHQRRLQPGEAVDAYLGFVKRLLTLNGECPAR